MTGIRIFKPIDERINLWVPILFLALIGVEVFFSKQLFSFSFLLESFIVDIVFLNITHNAFTYAIIVALPEMRPWVQNQGRGQVKSFWWRIAFLNVGLAIIFFLLFSFSKNEFYARALFYLVTIVFPVHHALSQSFGLSLIYNKKISEDVRVVELQERRFSRIFLVLVLIAVIIVTGFIGRFITIADPLAKTAWLMIRTLVFISSFSLLTVMLFYPKKIRRFKLFFSLRYMVWAFSIFSPIAIAGTKVIHGLEYAFVTRKMISKSRASTKAWLKIAIAMSILVLILAYFRFSVLVSYPQEKEMPFWFYLMASVSFAFTYSHYYLDRQLFRMRKPINRQTVGQLLNQD